MNYNNRGIHSPTKSKEVGKMRVIKTWCENTKEGKNYLKYNNYGTKFIRIFKSNYFLCFGKCNAKKLYDVRIIF
jgi:hypothetical protein